MKTINITGARQNNLKNISLQIPKNKITVFTGISGSGKSSLIFETIGAEAQRQINETQHSFVRNRLQHHGIADVDKIENLNVPVIINQKRIGGNARSIVGTVTDIAAQLRLLFSRIGQPFVGYSNVFSFNNIAGMCPRCQGLGYVQLIDVAKLIDGTKSLNEGAINFPSFKPNNWRWTRYVNSGYFDNDKKLMNYTEKEWNLLLYANEHKPKYPNKDWGKTVLYEGIIPRIEKAFLKKDSKEYEQRKSIISAIIKEQTCPSCQGTRLNEKILSCKIDGENIATCSALPIDELLFFIKHIHAPTYEPIIQELTRKLENMIAIGLQYLSLDRATNTLSGGESQRIKMVKHLGNSLVDLLYIFDEPSIGLHPKDVDNIVKIIRQLNLKGNTVLIVEHDPDLIKIADHIVDMGPLSGKHGGEIIYEGKVENLSKSTGKTGEYFAQPKGYNRKPRKPTTYITIKNAKLHNLKNITVSIPKNLLTVITGVAGSGKTTLINKVLPQFYPHVKIINQSLFVASPRANVLTYLGILDEVRNLFAQENRVKSSLFSRNSDGACPDCKGLGVQKIDLAFMDDIEETCEECSGSGYKNEVLNYLYKGKNIVDIMNMTVEDAESFFDYANLSNKFNTLIKLGLEYLTLGQRLDSFSGGERQRLKLSKELSNSNNIIVLDEPSTGLHPADTEKLMQVLNELVKENNTVIVIEHNLDIISQADWIIDMGIGAGKNGGTIVFEGTVADLRKNKVSETAKYLNRHLT